MQSSGRKREVLQDKFSKEIADYVKNIGDGETRIIPFGWMGEDVYDPLYVKDHGAEGHSLLMQLRKKDGKFEITVFNTGDGAYIHKKTEEGYYPFVVENVSPEHLNEEFFTHLTQLTSAQSKSKTGDFMRNMQKNLRISIALMDF